MIFFDVLRYIEFVEIIKLNFGKFNDKNFNKSK